MCSENHVFREHCKVRRGYESLYVYEFKLEIRVAENVSK